MQAKLQRTTSRTIGGHKHFDSRRATGRAGSRRERASPAAVSGDTMSTASWAPFHKGSPLAMTSMRRSSKRDRHIEVTDKGVRGHSSPGLTAHAGERAASTPECTRPGARCTVVAKRVKRATTPTGAGGQGQGEAEAPQEESTQGFGGEGELRAGRNGGERPTAEWASLGKQKGLRGHIQLSQELRLEMRGDCGRSWRLPAPRAGFGQVVAWLIGLGGGLGTEDHSIPWASQTRPQQALPVTEARLGGWGRRARRLQAWQQRRRRSAGAGGAAREECRPTRPNTRPERGRPQTAG